MKLTDAIRQTVSLAPAVRPYLTGRARYIVALKGGEGSGNFGHAGRPGEVGGSAPSGEGGNLQSIKDKEEEIRSISNFEKSAIFDNEGNLILEKSGGTNNVIFTKEESQAIKENGNAILTHNHPFVASFSNGDIVFAADHNLQEIRVVDEKYAYSLLRPSSGWPDASLMKSVWTREFNKQVKFYHEEIKYGRATVAEANENATHAATLKVSEKFGVPYDRQ